jgi:prephenate dehydrogenase
MDLLVVGAGAMGTWTARATGAAVDAVTFVDADHDAAVAAAAELDGEDGPSAAAARDPGPHDAACVAVPIPAAREAIATAAGVADRALLDVTGAMADPVAAMAEHAPDRERASLHPLFAPDAEPGSVAVVRDAPGPVTDALLDAVAARGNDLFETTPAEHDAAMESVQAAAHAAVLAYGLAAADVREEFHTPVSRALTDLVGRVTGGEPRVYADVQATFDGAEAVADAAARIAGADHEAFEAMYRDAGDAFPGASESPPADGGRGADR